MDERQNIANSTANSRSLNRNHQSSFQKKLPNKRRLKHTVNRLLMKELNLADKYGGFPIVYQDR